MRINNIDLEPAANPAVLDTFTWDELAATRQLEAMDYILASLADAVGTASCTGCLRSALAGTPAVPASAVLKDATGFCLVNLPDGQKVFVTLGTPPELPPAMLGLFAGGRAAAAPVDTRTVRWFITEVAPEFAPGAYGPVPRLGIGARQTVTVWPGIIEGVRLIGCPAETIQNSAYRELAPAHMILAPPSEEVAYLPGHGSVNIGHTGSSIEGFWTAGVVTHIEHGADLPYGADLDHIPVKSADAAGIAKAKRLIDCGRHYTFFTLDTSFLFDSSSTDLAGRYDVALAAAAEIYSYIKEIKDGEPFDFEFSLDEAPQLTSAEELRYVLSRLDRSGVRTAFVAPNVGFEKRLDYRLPDGLPGLETRVTELAAVADGFGALLDFHSGSDKSTDTYRAISRACRGRLKLKVSGKLQLILAEVLADLEPDFFNEWWDYTLRSAEAEARAGSTVAAEYVKMVYERRQADGASFRRSPADRFFADFSFGMVGAKDERGNFIHRHRFYTLPRTVRQEYTRRVTDYLIRLAEDLGLRSD